MAALVEVMSYYKHQATDFEAEMWTSLIEEVGDDVMKAFLRAHVQRSTFAPRVSEAMAMLRPGANNAVSAFEQLSQSVERVGPYKAPAFADIAITEAVHRLGGWSAVCEQFPTSEQRFDREAFFKRFEVCYQIGAANVLLDRPRPEPLRGLHAITNGQRQLALEAARQAMALTDQRDQREVARASASQTSDPPGLPVERPRP